MSFAEKYLSLVTDCSKELKQTPKYSFFGVEANWSTERATDIVRGSVEEWEDTERFIYEKDGEKYRFDFSTYEDCLFNRHCLNETNDPDVFIIQLFQYEVEDIKDNTELLHEIFTKAKETGKLGLFTACYATAVEAKIIATYKEKYQKLKAEYPGLPYYPTIGFNYDLTDYYESSTC